jgi:hypothetical protein
VKRAANREEWRSVTGLFADFYEVSDRGRVRASQRIVRTRTPAGQWTKRTLKPKLLKQAVNRRGHRRVMLSVTPVTPNAVAAFGPAVRQHAYVHTLVAEAFLGIRPEGMMVCHRDDVKRNNRASNLYYGTQKQNAQDALRNGCHGTERRRRRK